jgi:PIN domain nuclease of toxin-antitoxin system
LVLLLDTHVFLWFASRPRDLANDAFLAIEDPVNDVFISAVAAWEIVLKHAKGKLTLPLEPALYMSARLRDFGFHSLPITQDHALATASLPDIHADPFDRMMIAQAQVEGMTFVTRAAHALAYPVKTLAG